MSFTTSAVAPVVVTKSATAVGTSSATLNATVNANGDSSTVTFEYGTSISYGTTLNAVPGTVVGVDDTVVNRSLSGLINGTTYHYRVVATNSAGTVYGADMIFTVGAIAPTAITNAATGVNAPNAILNGMVNANNGSASVNFEYGASTSYGRALPASPGTVVGNSNTSVNVMVSDLSPNMTYHYRVAAFSAGGATYGADMRLTTGSGPQVTTGIATSLGISAATLNGTVNGNGQNTTVTFEYGLTATYGISLPAPQSPVAGSTDTAVSLPLTFLNPGTTYHYRVVGQNASGTTYGANVTFVTEAADARAPTAITIPVTAIGTTTATLAGRVVSNNLSTAVTFEYGFDTNYGNTVTADQSPVQNDVIYGTDVSKAVASLTSGVTYHYRVVAQNAYGISYGADLTFFTEAQVVSAVTNAASGVGVSSATLNATVNPVGSAFVEFEYGLSGYGSTVAAPTVISDVPVAVNAALTGLTSGTIYHYRVRMYGGSVLVPVYGYDMIFTTGAVPTAVTSAATTVGTISATLNGIVNANNTVVSTSFEYGLDFSYGATMVAAQSPVGGGTDTDVSVVGNFFVPNTTYHYRVVAQNVDITVYGADMTFTTGGAPPLVATNVATALSSTGATLNGTVNANNDSSVVTFEYGLTTAYGNLVTASESPVSSSSNTPVTFSLTALSPDTIYHYRVVALNGSGTSYGVDMVFTTGGAVPGVTTTAATSVANTRAILHGVVNANSSSTSVVFEYGETTAYGRIIDAGQSPVPGSVDTAVSGEVVGLNSDTLYHFRVVGQNAYGTESGADMIFITDNDGDGVPRVVEDGSPNGGDGNGDGTLDSLQPGVSSIPSATGSGYITVEIVSGCLQLANVQTFTEASQGIDPEYYYPYGLAEFEIPCSSATVRIYYHGTSSLPDYYTYRKYGPTPPNFNDHQWYTLPGTSFGTLNVGGESVAYAEFALNDGQLGDDTGLDGVIFDQGGPAMPEAMIPTLSEWGLIVLMIILSGVVLQIIRRRGSCEC